MIEPKYTDHTIHTKEETINNDIEFNWLDELYREKTTESPQHQLIIPRHTNNGDIIGCNNMLNNCYDGEEKTCVLNTSPLNRQVHDNSRFNVGVDYSNMTQQQPANISISVPQIHNELVSSLLEKSTNDNQYHPTDTISEQETQNVSYSDSGVVDNLFEYLFEMDIESLNFI